jgi:hypothetical protein
MMKITDLLRQRLVAVAVALMAVGTISAQSLDNGTRGVVEEAIPGDGVVRFYRMAIPVTLSAYEQDFNGDYNEVVLFWQETERYLNQLYVPLGFVFDVIEDKALVLNRYNEIDENVFNAPGFGTELLNNILNSSAYDIGMWVTHRDEYEENSGLSVENGAYRSSTKANGYAKSDKWVVAHEVGHLLGANHTPGGEGSLMDNLGEFLSYPSIRRIRKACMELNGAYYQDEERKQLVGNNGGGNYVFGIKTENSVPKFDEGRMMSTYRIPQGSLLRIPLYASDTEGDTMEYMSIGCNSANIDNVSEGYDCPHFASLPPQVSNVVSYEPQYTADIFYDDFYYPVVGTDIQNLYPGSYSISFIVRDVPEEDDQWTYEGMKAKPFYSQYAVWEAMVQIISGREFTVEMQPQKLEYTAGEKVILRWNVNDAYFTQDSKLHISLSDDYGKTFAYTLSEGVSALDGETTITLPQYNIGVVEKDFITAKRQMRGGVIKVEEADGCAYMLTSIAPDSGGGFTVTGGYETGIEEINSLPYKNENAYDISGRKIRMSNALPKGIYIVDGRKVVMAGSAKY